MKTGSACVFCAAFNPRFCCPSINPCAWPAISLAIITQYTLWYIAGQQQILFTSHCPRPIVVLCTSCAFSVSTALPQVPFGRPLFLFLLGCSSLGCFNDVAGVSLESFSILFFLFLFAFVTCEYSSVALCFVWRQHKVKGLSWDRTLKSNTSNSAHRNKPFEIQICLRNFTNTVTW